MRVRVSRAVLSCSSKSGVEEAWWLVGERSKNQITVHEAVSCGIDSSEMSVQTTVGLMHPIDWVKVVGLLHTHPVAYPEPSETDLRIDQQIVEMFGHVGLFGIHSDRLRWFTLRAGDRHYTTIQVTES